MLRQSILVSALALATSTYAQSSSQSSQVVSVLAIGGAGDQQNLFASVVDNDATATTLKIGCDQPTNAAATESVLCNLFSGFDVIVGPSTFAAGYEYNSGTMTITCAVTGTTTASCKQTVIRPVDDMDPNVGGGATATGGGDEGEIFSTVSGTDTGLVTEALETTLAGSDMTYYPVTITAGSLKSGGEGDGGNGSGTGSTMSGTGTAAASASESASASGGSGSSGAGQLVIEILGVAAAGSIGLLMVML